LREGSSTYELSLSITFGLLGGVFPILFSSTVIVFLITTRCNCLQGVRMRNGNFLRLNKVLAQVMSVVSLPLNYWTLRWFLWIGWSIRSNMLLLGRWDDEFVSRWRTFFEYAGWAVVGWIIAFPPLACILFLFFVPLINGSKVIRRRRQRGRREYLINSDEESGVMDCGMDLDLELTTESNDGVNFNDLVGLGGLGRNEGGEVEEGYGVVGNGNYVPQTAAPKTSQNALERSLEREEAEYNRLSLADITHDINAMKLNLAVDEDDDDQGIMEGGEVAGGSRDKVSDTEEDEGGLPRRPEEREG